MLGWWLDHVEPPLPTAPLRAAEVTSEVNLGARGMRFTDARRWMRRTHGWFHRSTGVDWRGDPEGDRLRGAHVFVFGATCSFHFCPLALRQGSRAHFFIASREARPEDAPSLRQFSQGRRGHARTRTTIAVASSTDSAEAKLGGTHPRWHWIVTPLHPVLPRVSHDRGLWYVFFLCVLSSRLPPRAQTVF